MNQSMILRTATVFLLPLMLLFSLILLLRGHDEPGGGFVGGLVAASAFAVYAMANGPAAARKLLRLDLHVYIGVGLLIALVSGLVGVVFGGKPYMTGQWTEKLGMALVPLSKLGTPQMFDLGVYITVAGVVLMMLLTLAEKTAE